MERVSAAEVEAKLVAHWRALPQSLAQEDDGGTTNKLLLSFLSALRSALPAATSTETPGGGGCGEGGGTSTTSWLVSTASEASGSHEVWVEGVQVLFWWVFVSDGPHACLSFLDASRGQSEEDGGGLEQDKAALFCRLGPALLWGNPYAPEWAVILPVDAVPQVLTMLCSRLQQASSAAVANVPATSVLLVCLSHIGRLPHAWAYSKQKELVVSTLIGMFTHSADPVIATLVLTNFLPRESMLLWHTPTLSDKLRELIDDSRAALSVREAALRLTPSAMRDDGRILFELATDGSAPPSLRCAALSLMTELRSHKELVEVFETALTLAGEQMDERVVIAATQTLCHWRVTIDLEMADVRPFIHRALCLATNLVRKEPDVPTLLDLAADTVVRFHCVDLGGSLPDSLLLSLPLDVHGLLEAKQSALLKKADPKHHKKTLRTVTRTCLTALSEMLEHDLYDLMRPAIVSMLHSDNRWQLREGGLLVLGCLLPHCGDHQSGDREAMLSLIMPAISDPRAKVRKMGCWVLGLFLREPCEVVTEASKLFVRLAVDDPNRGVRRKALLALEDNNWTWYAEAVLKECFGVLQRDQPLEEATTVAVLGVIARGLRLITLWAEANPSANHGLYLDVVQGCMQTLLDGLPMLAQDATTNIQVLQSLRKASDISQFAASVDGDYKLGCLERHFGSLLARSHNCEEQVNECMLAFWKHKLHQPTAKFGKETATRIVWVAAAHMITRAEHVQLALWALTCISDDYPDCVTSLMDPIISALVALSAALPADPPTTSVRFCHCLDRLIATCGVARMRPHVGTLSSALVANITRRSPFDMALRCCLLLVPCGVSDIDDRVLFHLIEAGPLRTITETSQEITLRVSTESLASLVVELFTERGLDECGDPKVASAVLALLADRLQRDTSNLPSAGTPQPPAAVRERVGQALSVLAAAIGHGALQADRKKWRKFRRGLNWYLPAASPLLALLLGRANAARVTAAVHGVLRTS